METPLPSTPPAPCCSLKSKLICLSAGLVALVIVAIASFLLGRTLPRSPEGALRSAPTIAISPTLTPAIDETTNWKTYTNIKYNFEIKYPPSLTPNESRSVSANEPLIDFYDESGSAPMLMWNLYVTKKSAERIFAELIAGQNNNDPQYYKYQVTSQKPYIVDSQHQGYSVKTTDRGGEKITIIIPVNDSATAVFQSLGFDANIFDLILSTFKFSD